MRYVPVGPVKSPYATTPLPRIAPMEQLRQLVRTHAVDHELRRGVADPPKKQLPPTVAVGIHGIHELELNKVSSMSKNGLLGARP